MLLRCYLDATKTPYQPKGAAPAYTSATTRRRMQTETHTTRIREPKGQPEATGSHRKQPEATGSHQEQKEERGRGWRVGSGAKSNHLTLIFDWISRSFLRASTWMCELTCFRVRVFPVRNLIYRAINSFRPAKSNQSNQSNQSNRNQFKNSFPNTPKLHPSSFHSYFFSNCRQWRAIGSSSGIKTNRRRRRRHLPAAPDTCGR